METAIHPKARPVKAPNINDGEKTPPPMRPANVITTAIPFTNAKIIAVQKNNPPFKAVDIVSYPTPTI